MTVKKFEGLIYGIVISVICCVGFFILLWMSNYLGNVATSYRNKEALASIETFYISDKPFGEMVTETTPGSRLFYNLDVKRTAGQLCYVRVSWRWVDSINPNKSVMWIVEDGGFVTDDKTSEKLAQSFKVPDDILPGDYTLNRLALFRCGYQEIFSIANTKTDIKIKD